MFQGAKVLTDTDHTVHLVRCKHPELLFFPAYFRGLCEPARRNVVFTLENVPRMYQPCTASGESTCRCRLAIRLVLEVEMQCIPKVEGSQVIPIFEDFVATFATRVESV